MSSKMKIQDVMHPFPYTIGAEQTLSVAKKLFEEHGVRHLPVQRGGALIGILSDRDHNFARAVEKKEVEDLIVEECCTLEPYVVAPDTSLDIVARRMAHDHIGCALVVENNKLVGIFTAVDACRTLAEVLSGSYEQ